MKTKLLCGVLMLWLPLAAQVAQDFSESYVNTTGGPLRVDYRDQWIYPSSRGVTTGTVELKPGEMLGHGIATWDVETRPGTVVHYEVERQITAITALAPLVTLQPLESQWDTGSSVLKRLWNEGGQWRGQLARPGLRFVVTSPAGSDVSQMQLEALAPGGIWNLLAAAAPSAGGEGWLKEFSVSLGALRPGSPWVPLGFPEAAQTGTWQLRARGQSSSGAWGEWCTPVSVEMELPVAEKVERLRAEPPAGPLGAWYRRSPEREFRFRIWVP